MSFFNYNDATPRIPKIEKLNNKFYVMLNLKIQCYLPFIYRLPKANDFLTLRERK